MHLPISAKMLFRFHQKIFMLRLPRPFCRHAFSLSFSSDGKTPLCQLHVEKKRIPAVWIVLGMAATVVAALAIPYKK